MALTTKIVGDSVTAKNGAGDVVWQADVEQVLTDYYVVKGCYFQKSDGAGVGNLENGLTIEDPAQADTDRLTDLTTILGNRNKIRWTDMTDAELSTIADIVTNYT
jgi:hypothetical protein